VNTYRNPGRGPVRLSRNAVIGGAFLVLTFALLALFVGSWVVMACFNSIHHDCPAIPAFGFWASLGWLVLVNFAGTALALGSRSSTK
jgi:hypothetical protein